MSKIYENSGYINTYSKKRPATQSQCSRPKLGGDRSSESI